MMKRAFLPIVVVLVVMSLSAAFGQTPEPVKFVSDKPFFARIGLGADEAKTLLVACDESGGTGSGYDTLYADTDFNGVLEAAEKATVEGGAGTSYITFPALNFSFGYNEKATGVDEPLTLTLSRSSWLAGKPEFAATLRARLREGDQDWEYAFRKTLEMSTDPKQAVAQAPRPLTANVRLQRGHGLGIAVTFSAGDFTLNCRTPLGNPRIRVQVLNAQNETVSDDTVPLDRLGFG